MVKLKQCYSIIVKVYVIALIFSLVVLIPSGSFVYADFESIKSDKSLYSINDIIHFSGNVGTSDINEIISVIVRDSDDNFVVMASGVSDFDGNYEVTIEPNSQPFKDGFYQAILYLNDVPTDEIAYFDFSSDGTKIQHNHSQEMLLKQQNQIDFKEKIATEDIAIVDSDDDAIEFAMEDNPVQISADVINLENKSQSFTYIVQIIDSNQVPVSISWLSGMVNDDQTFDVSLSWTPENPGLYTAEIYVWESMITRTALSEPDTVAIVVA